MRRLARPAMVAALAGALLAAPTLPALADQATITFESGYSAGNINGQQGWTKTGAYDAAVASTSVSGFGSQALRISNAVTSGSFGDQTFTPALANEAGETAAVGDGTSGPRQRFFQAEFQFASTVPNAEQPGLRITVSPDRGDGARMAFAAIRDAANGLAVDVSDYNPASPDPDPCNRFTDLTEIASGLDRGASHTLKFEIEFYDGRTNDVVRTYVDGQLKHTAGTWENYYQDCIAENPPSGRPPMAIDQLLFRVSGTAAPATSGQGFFIDNLALFSGPLPAIPTAYVRTDGDDLACNGTADAAASASPNCAFKTVQHGVDSVTSGGTVHVGPGTFAGADGKVDSNKSVTLQGAGRAATIIDGQGTTAGWGIHFAAGTSGLTIKDLKVTGFKDHGIYADGPLTNLTIDNVESSNNTDPGTSARGIVVWNGLKNGVTITNSIVNANKLVGIGLQDGSATGVTITGNTVTGNGDAGIYALGLTGPGANRIANNTVTDNGRYGIDTPLPNGSGADSGPGSIVVENNVVSRTVAATDPRDYAGIIAQRRAVSPIAGNEDHYTGVVIQNNEVSGFRRKVGAPTGSDGFGIVVAGTNMTVRNNTLTNNDVGIQAQMGNTPAVGDADQAAQTSYFNRDNAPQFTGTINLNSVVTNDIGIRGVGLDAAVDVTKNWYGSATGPTNAANPSGTGASVVGANLTFEQWLCSGTDTSVNTGFQPNAGLLCPVTQTPSATVYVRTDGDNLACNGTVDAAFSPAASPNCSLKTITAGVSLVTSGGTVYVGPGTYAENVSIGKALTLHGANAGNDARSGKSTRGPESIVDGGGTSATIAINANGAVVDGFTIKGGAGSLNAGVHIPGGNAGWQLLNNIITDNVIGVYANSNGPSTIAKNLFDANNRPGPAGGSGIYSESTNGLTVDQNEFRNHSNNTPAIFASVAPPSHLSLNFTNNQIHDNISGVYALAIDGGVFSGNTISTTATALALASGNNNVTVQNNDFTGSTRGLRIEDDGYGFPANSNVTVVGNTFVNNSEYGLALKGGYTGTLNAEKNWWGTQRGPSVTANPGGNGTIITGALAASVDFSPWCSNQACTAPFYAVPTRLAFATQPANGTEGSPLSTQPIVRAEDADSNLGINFSGSVALAISGTNTENAALLGTTSTTAADGVATYTNVGFNDNGTGLTLTASTSVPGIAAGTSNPFTVANANPTVTITAPANNSEFIPGQPVAVSATLADAGANDTLTCSIDFGDGTGPVAGTVNGTTCTATHTYGQSQSGTVTIAVTASDDDSGTGSGSVTLTARASIPVASVADVSVTEGNGGASNGVNATFTVTLDRPAPQAASVQYATVDGTARAPEDYVGQSGTITFAAGETSRAVSVLIIGDTLPEPDETFTLQLSNPAGLALGRDRATGTIKNDDLVQQATACSPRPQITVATQAIGGGRLQVTVSATSDTANPGNVLKTIQFSRPAQNATVEIPGQASVGTSPITFPAGTRQMVFVIKQTTPNQPATVPFTVTDNCGTWDSFAGAGASGFGQ
ncbi:MAG: right-handed parallel beta-helix repeat-containing protein [Chloroflexi bacterium]|nr:right-handed parallel beta-helix repeat-containing protein [Chloroflexota bacterium]